jgi:carboxypeptidase family protein
MKQWVAGVMAGLTVACARDASAQTPTADSTRRSALAGVVRDSLGHPLPLVTVIANGRDLTAVTDDSGRFHLRGIPSGRREFTIMRLGFTQLNFEATLPPDSTVVIDVRLRRVQNLSPVQVTGEAASPRLARAGYFERQRLGLGKYVSPARIDSLNHVMTPSQLLRDIPGVIVRCKAAGRCTVLLARGGCLDLFVNGHYTRGQIDDVMNTPEVYAIEVYTRRLEIPMEFHAPLRGSCGQAALAVWTRSYAR